MSLIEYRVFEYLPRIDLFIIFDVWEKRENPHGSHLLTQDRPVRGSGAFGE